MMSVSAPHISPPWNFQSAYAGSAAANGNDDGTPVNPTAAATDGPSQNKKTAGSTTTTGAANGTDGESSQSKGAAQAKGTGAASDNLTPEQMQEVEKLQNRDKEVKAHEMAHLMAAAGYARGGAHYDYEVGPDGKRYAVGGEVSIDVSKIPGDPKATIRKMRTVESAALAPASPSAQDRQVAARAEQVEVEMQLQLLQLNMQQADTAYRKRSDPNGSDMSASGKGLVNVMG
jgi:SprA-related family